MWISFHSPPEERDTRVVVAKFCKTEHKQWGEVGGKREEDDNRIGQFQRPSCSKQPASLLLSRLSMARYKKKKKSSTGTPLRRHPSTQSDFSAVIEEYQKQRGNGLTVIIFCMSNMFESLLWLYLSALGFIYFMGNEQPPEQPDSLFQWKRRPLQLLISVQWSLWSLCFGVKSKSLSISKGKVFGEIQLKKHFNPNSNPLISLVIAEHEITVALHHLDCR